MIVRDARPLDIPSVVPLIKELEEGSGFNVVVTEEALQRDFFGAAPVVNMTVAADAGKIIGYTIWNLTYTSRFGKFRLYMADLCVTESERGNGVGKALVADLARRCVENGYERLEWKTLVGSDACDFYDAIGGELRDDVAFYRSTAKMFDL